MNTIKELTQQEKYNTMLKRKNREIKSLKEQLEYLRSNEYLNQVKLERDINEKLNDDYKLVIDKAIEYIESIDEVEVRFLQRDKIYDLGIREYDIKKYLKKHIDLEGQYIKLNREKILDILKGSDKE